MATWQELKGSPQLKISSKNPTGTAKYIVLGIATDAGMDEAVRLETPDSLLGMSRLDYSADHQGGGVWFVDVSYGVSADGSTLDNEPLGNQTFPEAPAPLPGITDPSSMTPNPDAASQQDTDKPIGPEFSFDTTGGTQHITQSLQTISRTGRGLFPAINHLGAIGVTSDNVAGTDIVARSLNFTYTAKFKFISVAYILFLSDMTGRTNTDSLFGCAAGTLLFKGASGSYSGGQWSITFTFARSPNVSNITICTGLVVPAKKGWEYLWVEYEPDVQGTAPATVPRAAYVERVYDSAPFIALGI